MQTLKEIKEAIAAFERDGKVEWNDAIAPMDNWKQTSSPLWNFERYKYRPMPKSMLRAYVDVEEFQQAKREHGPGLVCKDKAIIYPVRIDGTRVKYFNCRGELFGYDVTILQDLTWEDGTPFGVIINKD